jgi:hypothetical protein
VTSYIGRGARDPGPWNQPGVIVVEPTWVAFVPTAPRTHVASIVAKAAAGALTGVMALEVGGREVSPANLIGALEGLPEAELLPAIRRLVASTAGVLYPATEARYRENVLPLGVRLSFETPGDRLLVLDAKGTRADPRFTAIVAQWPRFPLAEKKPIAAWIGLASGAMLGLVGLASSAFTILVLATALGDGTEAGRTTSAFFCCLDLMLLAPATGLVAFGMRRLRQHRSPGSS